MKIHNRIPRSQWALSHEASDDLMFDSIEASRARKQKLVEKWESIYPSWFWSCRDKGLDILELAQLLENQDKYLRQMTEQQKRTLFDDIGMTLENIFPNIIDWYIDLCKVPDVTILGAETTRNSAYIRRHNKDGQLATSSYQFSPRPTPNFDKNHLEALIRDVKKHGGGSNDHMIVSILVPFISTGIAQQQNFYSPSGIASYLDWVSDCNVGAYNEITLNGSLRNIWSI